MSFMDIVLREALELYLTDVEDRLRAADDEWARNALTRKAAAAREWLLNEWTPAA